MAKTRNEMTKERANEIAFSYLEHLVRKEGSQSFFIQQVRSEASDLGISDLEATQFGAMIILGVFRSIHDLQVPLHRKLKKEPKKVR